MSKMNDEEKKEYKKVARVARTIENVEAGIGKTDIYGICSKCSNFSYREYEHGHRTEAYCANYSNSRRLVENQRITRCNDFAEKGSLSIEAMWAMAKMIHAEKEKNVIGFDFSHMDEDDLFLIEEGTDE